MKKWEKPEVRDLRLQDTFAGIGNEFICPVCCKTSNPNANGNGAFHEGNCIYSKDNKDVLVPNDGSIVCKNHS